MTDHEGRPYDAFPEGKYTVRVILSSVDGKELASASEEIQIGFKAGTLIHEITTAYAFKKEAWIWVVPLCNSPRALRPQYSCGFVPCLERFLIPHPNSRLNWWSNKLDIRDEMQLVFCREQRAFAC